ncbi:hypothetical protein OESDEN_12846 [Oesophagostomum dentatum]|uniref:Uncharacterized protein n=1 Tax=Oesophagostomum dentatum TaxID=61180 RepID=A0A0B1SV12_OESDE|nr:hypothetical protein OESDEN_12846 [Oesophagostomum dentatum]
MEYRRERYREYVDGRVLSQFVKIKNIPLCMKKEDFDDTLLEIVKLLRYDLSKDDEPLKWPQAAGIGSTTMNLTAQMTYKFWRWFCRAGRTNLADYNRRNGTRIVLEQEKTIKKTDRHNLCLYLRTKIRKLYEEKGKTPIDVTIRRDKIELGTLGQYDPVILAMRLGLSMSDWNGESMDELLEPRYRRERREGRFAVGELVLPGLEVEEQEKEKENEAPTYSQAVRTNNKRQIDDEGFVLPKRKK